MSSNNERNAHARKIRKKIFEKKNTSIPKVWNKQIVDNDSVDSDERFVANPPSPGTIKYKQKTANLYKIRKNKVVKKPDLQPELTGERTFTQNEQYS